MGAASRLPIYPTMPHTSYHRGVIRNNAGTNRTGSFNRYIIPYNAIAVEYKRAAFHIIPDDCAELRFYRAPLYFKNPGCHVG